MRMAKREPPESTPICRCRVLYLGSSVPQVTKDGLQGIQEPLRELYPAEGAVSARGIDSWLSVWSNGLLLENVDENQKKVTRFFPIESLHYCAAVRYVVVSGGKSSPVPRFLPLDSPFARNPNINHPPLFACIMRRTMGIKVLECHAFICKRETPANALVGCCFHAYADSMYAKRLEAGNSSQYGSVYNNSARATEELAIEVDYTGDLSSANSEIIPVSSSSSPTQEIPTGAGPRDDEVSIYNGDENHKVWAGAAKENDPTYSDYSTATIRSARSVSSLYGTPNRVNRPRQLVMPSVAPPPPALESDSQSKRGKKDRRHHDEMNKITNGELMARPPSVPNDKRIPLNGSLHRGMNGGVGRPNGSLMRSANGHSLSSKSKGRIPKMFSSLAERKSKQKRPPPPFVMLPGPPPPHSYMGPPPPNMMQPPMHMMPVSHGGPMGPMPPYPMGMPGPHPGPPGRRPPSRAIEEPIYMPSSRPMSPTASYQPGHFPHEQYLLQQYATAGKPKYKKGKKKKNHKDEEDDVYGRKTHLNEKAFSHSIREEHRSRSYSSLVGVGTDGAGQSLTKKDREIMQMVADLDLSGDEIERVEPRPGVYRPPRSEVSGGTLTSRSSRR